MIHRLPVLHRPERFAVRSPMAACAAVLIGLFALPAWAATFVPLTTWSPDNDGWLAPGEGGYTFLGTGNNERGIAYGNGHLYLVSRTGGTFIRILDPSSGADLGSLDTTGITGGTFAVDNIAVGGDGAIYVANLTTAANTGTGAYKVYSWATEGSSPSVAYSGDSGLAGARVGDDLALTGSGSSTRLVAGYSNTPSVTGNNGYTIIDPTAGTATPVAFSGTPPNAGDLRLGITFTDSTHVLGAQGSNSLYCYTSFSGTTGTLISSPAIPDPAGATADRLMATTVIGAKTILAMQSTGDSHVSVYDVTNPSAPVYLASRNNTLTPAANGNGTGELAWGAATDNGNGTISQILYGMSSNQGIQAFTFTLESPFANNGDYNGDTFVDGGDYVIWSKTLGNSAVPNGSGADGDGNGTVGPEDYGHWRALYGNVVVGSGAIQGGAIPEPSTFVLALLAVAGGISRRSRRGVTGS